MNEYDENAASDGSARANTPPGLLDRPRHWLHALRSVPHRYVVAFLLYLTTAALLVHDWDGFVFHTAVQQLWQGLSPYDVALERPFYAFLGITDTDVQWYAYPPLPLLLMALTSLPAILFDLAPFLERVLIKVPVIVGGLALAAVGEAWTRHLGGSSRAARLAGLLLLFHPFFILTGPAWGMTDGLLMALLLGGLLRYDQGHSVQAGLLVSAAVLVKPFPALLLIALIPVLLARRGWRPVVPFVAAGTALATVVILPFLVHSPHGFWSQVVGNHLTRGVQGFTVWAWWPLSGLSTSLVAGLSLLLMGLGLFLVANASRTNEPGPGSLLFVLVAAAAVVLFFNRVVNEQYLAMVAAPLLILLAAGRLSPVAKALAHWVPGLAAGAVLLTGFHFITFIPPDLALPIFGRPVDAVAHDVREALPAFWSGVQVFFGIAIPATLAVVAVVTARGSRGPKEWVPGRIPRVHIAPAAFACFALVLLTAPGLLAPHDTREDDFTPAYEESGVAAFYYLWWHNPAHDPGILYGNWFPVSQHPEMGYYTNNRGVHRDHAGMMAESGIDTAIVSYHRGNLDRYTVFQEEAARAGLHSAPLIELNQIYDRPEHHPVDENNTLVPYAAYRLDDGTRDAIIDLVLDLEDRMNEPSNLRFDGRPVVYFYDSYVSGISFHPEDKIALADVLLDLYPVETLRDIFNDPKLGPEPEDLVRHHPERYLDFFYPGSDPAVWREAHLEQHDRFWTEIRAQLEKRLGPIFMISGEAHNERAGFEAGTIQTLANLGLFDGSFLYSPSFPWGNEPDAPFPLNFARWEDRNHWLAAFSAAQGHYSSTGIAPAYDDTVNRPHGFVIPATHEGRDFYDLSWESLARHPTDQAAIATFNEWFEGSSIEPSREYGDRHLKATSGHRDAFLSQERLPEPIVHIVHERSSRTHPDYGEMDASHGWGLRMITAAMRNDADHEHFALDAQGDHIVLDDPPALVLAEGGRPEFRLSPYVHDRLDSWLADGTPYLLFGPDAAGELRNRLPAGCEPGHRPEDPMLRSGDRLLAEDGVVLLQRNNETLEVGKRCEGNAQVLVKPWATGMVPADEKSIRNLTPDPSTEAACLGTILLALVPEAAPVNAESTCFVP